MQIRVFLRQRTLRYKIHHRTTEHATLSLPLPLQIIAAAALVQKKKKFGGGDSRFFR